MKRYYLILGALLTFAATTADAAGLNLRWSSCMADGGPQNRTSACTNNVGSNVLVASFVLPSAGVLQASGIELLLDIATAGATLPSWWTTSCRTGFITCNPTISASAVNCFDWAEGAAAGGLAAYNQGTLYGPSSARLLAGYAVASNNRKNVLGDVEYFAFNTVISNAKTTGTGSCAGCSTPACIAFTNLKMAAGTVTGAVVNTPTVSASNYALWHGGAGVSTSLGSGCPNATPTRNTTWGSVKSLYR